VSAVLTATFFGLGGTLSAVSVVHMLLALGGVEYEFYQSEVSRATNTSDDHSGRRRTMAPGISRSSVDRSEARSG
jgi:hypothetical protein